MTSEDKFVCAFILALVLGGKWFFGPRTCMKCDGCGTYGGYPCSCCGGKGVR